MPELTLNRDHPSDPIRFEVHVLNPSTGEGTSAAALFDTGNDHTVISRAIADSVGLDLADRKLAVQGIGGTSSAATAWVMLGIQFDDGHRVTFEHHEVAILSGALEEVLLGCDLLERFDVTIDRAGKFTLRC